VAKLPRIPRTVYANAGPIPVERIANLRDPDKPERNLFGIWLPDTRIIRLDRGMGPETAWQTLFHEQFHAWLDDNELAVSHNMAERLCGLYASGRMGEWWEKLRKGR
jgi:hypothetical protein